MQTLDYKVSSNFQYQCYYSYTPITIALVLIVIVNKYVALSKLGMQLTMAVVTLISILSVVGSTFKVAALSDLIAKLPLAAQSLEWLVPAVVCLVIAAVLPNKQKR